MSEDFLASACSPTLAGLKLANLFPYPYETLYELYQYIAYYNNMLNKKGVYFKALKAQNGKALIYAYRKKQLQKLLRNAHVAAFLKSYGYQIMQIKDCLSLLEQHLLCSDFPHEIGIFLGYPLDDVKGFVRNNGKGYKCVGCWKVYTNEDEAKVLFRKYKQCQKKYCEKVKAGTEIAQLTIAV